MAPSQQGPRQLLHILQLDLLCHNVEVMKKHFFYQSLLKKVSSTPTWLVLQLYVDNKYIVSKHRLYFGFGVYTALKCSALTEKYLLVRKRAMCLHGLSCLFWLSTDSMWAGRSIGSFKWKWLAQTSFFENITKVEPSFIIKYPDIISRRVQSPCSRDIIGNFDWKPLAPSQRFSGRLGFLLLTFSSLHYHYLRPPPPFTLPQAFECQEHELPIVTRIQCAHFCFISAPPKLQYKFHSFFHQVVLSERRFQKLCSCICDIT